MSMPSQRVVAFIEATYTTHTPRQQADALRVSHNYICKVRGRLIREGRLDPAYRAGRVLWTEQKLADVQAAIESGEPLRVIARRYRTSVNSLRWALNRRGLSPKHLRMTALWQVRTREQVAHLFGVSGRKVRVWHRNKWLKMRPNGTGHDDGRPTRFHTYLVTDAALLDFLAVRAAWPMYNPDDITDPDWRESARAVRAEADGRWVTAYEYAELRHYSHDYVSDLIRSGRMPYSTQKLMNRWYIWMPNEEAQP